MAVLLSVMSLYAAVVCSIAAMPAFAAKSQRYRHLQCCRCPYFHAHWYAQAAFDNGNEEGNGDSDKGGKQATVTATKRATTMAMRAAGDKGAMVTVARAMAMALRVVGKQQQQEQ